MKTERLTLNKLIIICVILILANSISVAQKFEQIEGKTSLALSGFSLKSPSGDDWEYLASKDKKTVWFRDESFNFLTGEENKTYIRVFADSVTVPENKSEQEFADDYLANQYNKIIDQTKKSLAENDIDDVNVDNERKFDTVIAAKKFYSKAYSLDYSVSILNKGYSDNLLFVYLPENFKESHSVFVFDISGSYNQPNIIFNINSSDLKPIYRMIKSFKIDNNTGVRK